MRRKKQITFKTRSAHWYLLRIRGEDEVAGRTSPPPLSPHRHLPDAEFLPRVRSGPPSQSQSSLSLISSLPRVHFLAPPSSSFKVSHQTARLYFIRSELSLQHRQMAPTNKKRPPHLRSTAGNTPLEWLRTFPKNQRTRARRRSIL